MAGWSASGTVLIACNCDWGCPCNFNARPTHGHCEGGWAWLIDQGRIDDVDVSGLSLALFADWPAAIHEGGGVAKVFVDTRADEGQRAALGRLARGDLGGPWGIFINTYTLEGLEPAEFRVTLADHATRLEIGDVVELELEPIRNPVSGAEVHPEMVLPEGLVVNHASLASSKTYVVRDTIAWDHSGKYTAFGRFDYQG